jgi:hypothetical protein
VTLSLNEPEADYFDMADLPKKKLCFVVGPIGEEGTVNRTHADWVLKGIVRPVFDKYPDFEVKRADLDSRPGMIDSQLIADLLDAELVIADLSYLNANAFYEIGIRHMVPKPIIHLQLKNEKTPFDLNLYRSVKFARDTYDEIERAKEELGRQVEAVLAEDYQVDNPVTRARGQQQLRQDATPEMQLVMGQLEDLKNRVSGLELIAVANEPTFPSAYATSHGLGSVFPPGTIGTRVLLGSGYAIPAPPESGAIPAPPKSGK